MTGEELVYTNWHSGEPENQGGIEHYAMFCPEYTNGQWNDGDFRAAGSDGQIAFICEWDAKKTDWAFILPENLTVIQKEAFAGIAAESVKIPSGCTAISSRAFVNASMKDIYIPASVTSIADDAFAKGVTIWTPAGSPAAIWGKTYGYTVIETED